MAHYKAAGRALSEGEGIDQKQFPEPLQGLLRPDNMTFSTPAKHAYIFGRMVGPESAAVSRPKAIVQDKTGIRARAREQAALSDRDSRYG